MADVNGTDHLVRHEKDKLKGFDNEGYHRQERKQEEEESTSDDDRLRVVVTENGHRPEDDVPLPNGYGHEESNGHALNGTAVVVLEEECQTANMDDVGHRENSSDSAQKPLDTRLHHYVPVEDIDRRILNGSENTHVSIPEDAVISFSTGRIRVRKSASGHEDNDRESIPLETMLPAYDSDEKPGLGEKADLEAELANHKNGVWSSEGHTYGAAEGPFGHSEKLNGTSKASDEVSLPVSNHRKCLSREGSISSSSERKSTGEKLYFTEDSRKFCPGWRRILICGLILIIIAVGLLLGVLAATGILLAESDNKNTRYESLPSIDSVSHAGHSFRKDHPRPELPPSATPKVQGGGHVTVSRPPPAVTSKVPVLNDTSHSQTIVPNALVGEFTITNEDFTEDLKDSTSEGFSSLATHLERELQRIFKINRGSFETLKILNFKPGSVKVKFVVIWTSDTRVILANRASEIMASYFHQKHNLILAFRVDVNSVHFIDVFDECRVQKGGCAYECVWNYDTLSKTCKCGKDMVILPDGKSCGPKMITSVHTTISSEKPYEFPTTTSISQTTPSEIQVETTKEFLSTVAKDSKVSEDISTLPNILTTPNAQFSHKPLITEATTETVLTENEETVFPSTKTPFKSFVTEIKEQTLFPKETTTKATDAINIVEETSTETTINFSDLGRDYGQTNSSSPVTEYSSEATNVIFTETTLPEVYPPTQKTISEIEPNVFTTVEVETSTEQLTSMEHTYMLEANTTEPGNESIFELTTVESFEMTPGSIENETKNIVFEIPTTEPYLINIENVTINASSTITTTLEDSAKTILTSDVVTTSTDTQKSTKEDKIDSTLMPEITDYSETERAPSQISEGSPLKNEDTTLQVLTDSSIHESTTNSTFIIETTTELPKTDVKIEDIPTIFTTEDTLSSKYEMDTTTSRFHVSGEVEDKRNMTESTEYISSKEGENQSTTFDNDTFEHTTIPATDLDTTFPVHKDTTLKHDAETETTFDIFKSPNVTETTLSKEITTQNTKSSTFSEEADTSTLAKNLNLTESSGTTTPLHSLDFNESVTTFPPEMISTTSSQSGILLQSNRTPEVRSFDNFTDLDAVKNISLFEVKMSTVKHETEIFPNISTEITPFDDIITVTEPNKKTEMETLLPEKTEISITTAKPKTEPEIYFDTTINPAVAVENITEINAEQNVSFLGNSEMTFIPNKTSETATETSTGFEKSEINVDTTSNFPSEIVTGLGKDNVSLTNFTDSPLSTVTMNVEITTIPEAKTVYTIPSTQGNASEDVDSFPSNLATISEVFDNTTINSFITETISNNDFQTTGVPDMTTGSVVFGAEGEMKTSEKNYTLNESSVTTVKISENLDRNITSEGENNENLQNVFGNINNTKEMTSTELTTSNVTEVVSELETTQEITLMELFPTPIYLNFTDVDNFSNFYESELTTVAYDNESLSESNFFSNISQNLNDSTSNVTELVSLMPEESITADENSTELYSNFTTDGFEMTNETTTNASMGIECREDQFLCSFTNTCLNKTLICDGILDCADGFDEFDCHDSCQSNFMCSNISSRCIMSDARCDGIWDCENGTDEENCTPTECAKHEVMCLDGSKCIKPGHICDWNYNCNDRSDEVGCVERTTCESNGKFFCNDGLCIPWSLKCDGEFDCKDKEDEGNCTCLSDEFQCTDGKCVKSSMRCDGHQDCHDADDEMGCVNVDSQHIVTTYESYSGTWALLCAEDWKLDDGQYLCQELGFGHALKTEKVHVSFNGTWMAMRRDNLTDSSLWTERVSFVESCTSSLAAAVECQKFACGEYSGLLHRRRKREVLSSSSTQWPFIGYASTYHSKRGCLAEILTPIWLITSAECLLSISKAPHNGSDWYVRTNLGRNLDIDSAQNHEVLRIVTHPHSSKYRSLTLRDYDVALIRLKHALVFVSDKIGAICPPDEQVPPGITCFSGVLGSEKPRAPPPQSLTINSLALQIIDRKNCNRVEHYHGEINQRMLCTQSSEGHVICDNDEGTPLMCLSGINNWFLAGMLTYERFCDVYNKHPAVFSNLFAMRKFLDKVTGQKQYEIPYDNNVYIIIPPTTPSPTLPETTTEMLSTTLVSDTDFITTITESFNMTNFTAAAEITLPTGEYGENFTETIPGEMLQTTSISIFEPEENATTKPIVELHIPTTNISEEYGAGENVTSLIAIETSEEDFINTTTITSLDFTETNTPPTNDTIEMLSRTMPSHDAKGELLQDGNLEANDSTISPNDALVEMKMNATDLLEFENITTLREKILLDETTPYGETVVSSSSFNNEAPKAELLSLTTEHLIPTELPIMGLQNDSRSVLGNVSEISKATLPSKSVNSDTLETHNAYEVTTVPYNFSEITSTVSLIDSNATEIDHTDSITFEMAGEPYSDLEFSVFDNSDGIKVHYASLLENKTALNDSEGYLSRRRNLEILTKSSSSDDIEVTTEEVPTLSETFSFNHNKSEEVDFSKNSAEIIQNNITVTTESNESLALTKSTVESTTLITNTETEIEIEKSSTSESIPEVSENISGMTTVAATVSENVSDRGIVLSELNIHYGVLPNATVSEMLQNESMQTVETEMTAELVPIVKSITEKSDVSEKSTLIEDGNVAPSTLHMTLSAEDTTIKDISNVEESITTMQSILESNESVVGTDVVPDETVAIAKTESTIVGEEILSTVKPIQEFHTFMPANESILNNPEKYFRKEVGEEFISEKNADSLIGISTLQNNETEAFKVMPYLNISDKSSYEIFPTEASMKENTMFDDIAENFTLKEFPVPSKENSSAFNNTVGCGVWHRSNVSNLDEMNLFNEWPALGFLQMISEPKMCAATVVSAHHVITSLNCLLVRDNQLDPNKWLYVGGFHDEPSSESENQSHLVLKIIQYPVENFTSPSLLFNKGDLALVRIENEIKQNKYSTPACLPTQVVEANKTCFTVGWSNNTLGDDRNREFYSVPVTVISSDYCNSTMKYSGELPESFICVKHNNESFQACQMTVGSPLFCHNKNEHWEIQGVLNLDSPCDMEQLAVFESISGIHQWLNDILSK